MSSLKEKLPKIGIFPGAPVSYRNSFVSRPSLLSQAIRSMDAPQNWQQVSDIFLDEYWTDEVQGVAWDGSNWIFSCNANQSKPGANDKAIYVFRGGKPLIDDNWIWRINYKDVPHPQEIYDEVAGFPGWNSALIRPYFEEHWGQLICYNCLVYVSHNWQFGGKDLPTNTNAVVFKNHNGILEYYKWIKIDPVTSSDGTTGYPLFQAINPWDGKLYSTLLDNPREFFIHNPDNGEWEGKTLSLYGYLPGCYIQGACFSDNGHLYVSVDNRFSNWGRDYHWIFYYSALNGTFLGKIPVLATDDDHELEGICFAKTKLNHGRKAQFHAVLLENIAAALDNIWFKSFSADWPEVV